MKKKVRELNVGDEIVNQGKIIGITIEDGRGYHNHLRLTFSCPKGFPYSCNTITFNMDAYLTLAKDDLYEDVPGGKYGSSHGDRHSGCSV